MKSKRELEHVKKCKKERAWLYWSLSFLLFSFVIHMEGRYLGLLFDSQFVTNIMGLTFIPGVILLFVWAAKTPAPYNSYPDHFGF